MKSKPLILAALLLAAFLVNLDTTLVNVALPALVRQLHATTTQLQWVVDSFNLVFAALLLTFGSLSDRFGRKGTVPAGLTVFGAASLARGLTQPRPAHRGPIGNGAGRPYHRRPGGRRRRRGGGGPRDAVPAPARTASEPAGRGSPREAARIRNAWRMKTYAQYCAVARSLDLVGDRWVLLIVRELLSQGPCRFTDLRDGLPGIATNLLAARLKEMEENGLITHAEAAPPIATGLYQLTERGQQLQPVIAALVEWGLPMMPVVIAGEAVRGNWLGLLGQLRLRDTRLPRAR